METNPFHAHVFRWLDSWPIVRRLIGWSVVVIGFYLIVSEARIVVQKHHALPNIRHPIYWTKNLYRQAARNRSHAIAGDIATFYLVERLLADSDLIMAPSLENWHWQLEHVGRTHVTVSERIAPLPAEASKDLTVKATQRSKLEKHELYFLVEENVKTYVFVPAVGDADPLFIVPESEYRSRVRSGANLSAP